MNEKRKTEIRKWKEIAEQEHYLEHLGVGLEIIRELLQEVDRLEEIIEFATNKLMFLKASDVVAEIMAMKKFPDKADSTKEEPEEPENKEEICPKCGEQMTNYLMTYTDGSAMAWAGCICGYKEEIPDEPKEPDCQKCDKKMVHKEDSPDPYPSVHWYCPACKCWNWPADLEPEDPCPICEPDEYDQSDTPKTTDKEE